MTQKDKARVFDFMMTLGTLEFIYYVICMEVFDFKPKRLVEKAYQFNSRKKK